MATEIIISKGNRTCDRCGKIINEGRKALKLQTYGIEYFHLVCIHKMYRELEGFKEYVKEMKDHQDKWL